ncbi:MAG: hypothetical protein HY243_08045 [Proteobacteria bacterium]|nr:hypothetical protein [Pseudomonadota bacterium]
MRRTHEYFTRRLWSGRFPSGAIFVAAAFCFVMPLLGDALAGVSTRPDSILTGIDSWDGPCQKATGVDYVGGSDVYGNPVVSADVPSDSITVGMASETVVPEILTHSRNLDRVRVKIAVNGISQALNPDPTCPGEPPQAPAENSKTH